MTEPVIGAAPNSTPWDPAELDGRTCSACACYFVSVNQENPTQSQGFCRRNSPDMTEVRIQVPRLDAQKKAVIRDGQPVMNSEKVIGYLYKPAQAGATCFDGWREKGTLPGSANSQRQLSELRTTMERLAAVVLPPVS